MSAMFEGLVSQLILGYLKRYFKNLTKEQLKITIWKEEVLLENVELNLEAFDYLQLPFALKQGEVGKLSIKIPWKKLGWDPFIINLENVFICVAQRSDEEWSSDAVDKREHASKKAQLAAAELAKLSRRVYGNQVGHSFKSYMLAKLLDGIQVSIKDVHIQYRDRQNDQAQMGFGLRFSSLTLSKSNTMGSSSSGRLKGVLVNKFVDIVGLELSFSMTPDQGLNHSDDGVGSEQQSNDKFDGNRFNHILSPFDISGSLLVNKSDELDDDGPQYLINAESTSMVISLDEVILQQMSTLSDNLCICEFRKKYGRYRPWSYLTSRKLKGWQIAWWKYAQESVLSDVRKKLKKTSLRYAAQRLICHHKYVKLYKIKLGYLRQEQPVDEGILQELEQMEKASEIDDILFYRSVAEHETQEFLSKAQSHNGGTGSVNGMEKSHMDASLVGRSRGWLNWLSRGMLGAGGTDDSSQFSGVVSDEVVKDIYEATSFHHEPFAKKDTAPNGKSILAVIKCSIHQISATLQNREVSVDILKFISNKVFTHGKILEESSSLIATVSSLEVLNPQNQTRILFTRQYDAEKRSLENPEPCLTLHVDATPLNKDVVSSVKVVVQPLEMTYDTEFVLNVVNFYNLAKTHGSQSNWVLSSLDKMSSVEARLSSKAIYLLSSYNKVNWDVSFNNIVIDIPCRTPTGEPNSMLLESGAIKLISRHKVTTLSTALEERLSELRSSMIAASTNDLSLEFDLRDIYNSFEIELNSFEMKLLNHHYNHAISVLEKFSFSIAITTCVIPNESYLKQFEVCIHASSLQAHISPTICGSLIGILTQMDGFTLKQRSAIIQTGYADTIGSCQLKEHESPHFSVDMHADCVCVHLNLESDVDRSSALMLDMPILEIGYHVKDCEKFWVALKTVEITYFSEGTDRASMSLLSIGKTINPPAVDKFTELPCQMSSSFKCHAKGSFCVHYETSKADGGVWYTCNLCLNDAELHLQPCISGQLVSCYNKIYALKFSRDKKVVSNLVESMPQKIDGSELKQSAHPDLLNTVLDCFPFVGLHTASPLDTSERLFSCFNAEWRNTPELNDGRTKMEAVSLMRGSNKLNVDATGVRIHFHDSSCIIATASIPYSVSSVIILDNGIDVLCATDGISLSSSWAPRILENLWGPVSPSFSPSLNIRFKSFDSGHGMKTEICISVMHMCAVVPPEFLAVIIGYFSMSDWSSCGERRFPVEENEKIDLTCVTYKIEILDSTLIIPVESLKNIYLTLEIPVLYCRFVTRLLVADALEKIPSNCSVELEKVAESNYSMNIFGRNLSLLSLSVKDQGPSISLFEEMKWDSKVSLISSVCADVWVLIPRDSLNSSAHDNLCIMARVFDCKILSEGASTLEGFSALIDVIDQFSFVDDDSKYFKSDIFKFLELKRKREKIAGSESVEIIMTELRVCVHSMTVEFRQVRKDTIISRPLAKVNMHFACMASFKDDIPSLLELSFSSLSFCSTLNSVTLVQCNSTGLNSPVLRLCYFSSEDSLNELFVSLPALEIWFHFLDWAEVICYFGSYMENTSSTGPADAALRNSDLVRPDSLDVDGKITLEVKNNNSLGLIVKSDNIGMKVHFPMLGPQEESQLLTEVQNEIAEPDGSCKFGKCSKGLTIAACTRDCELVMHGQHTKLMIKLDNISGDIELSDENVLQSWPFFCSHGFCLTAAFISSMVTPHIQVDVSLESLDVCLSYQVFYFWAGTTFPSLAAQSSPTSSVAFKLGAQIRIVCLQLTDGRWSCNGPLLEVFMKNLGITSSIGDAMSELSLTTDLEVNCNNIHKVLWEPLVEPSKLHAKVTRKETSIELVEACGTIDICIESMTQLNLNFTESVFETIWRAIAVTEDGLGLKDQNGVHGSHKLYFQQLGKQNMGTYAPYVVQNMTSLPLLLNVYSGLETFGEYNKPLKEEAYFVQPCSSIPVYVNDTRRKQHSPYMSSNSIHTNESSGVSHHYVTIQFDGTSVCSDPISMDFVGLTYFEVDFCKRVDEGGTKDSGFMSISKQTVKEHSRQDPNKRGGTPVICDVSVLRCSKLIRLYSTVVLFNATSVPLELRFDIPFGLSHKVLDPIDPGQEFPLPLHLSEAGRMSWRPWGKTYLWSEPHNIANFRAWEGRMGHLRSFICYPPLPSIDPFRCCVSVQDISLSPSGSRCMRLHMEKGEKHVAEQLQSHSHTEKPKKQSIHYVVISTPLTVKSYLPEVLSLTVESSGVARTTTLSEVESSFYHIDSIHDLDLIFHEGTKSSLVKFPRMETFSTIAKFDGTSYFLSDIASFISDKVEGSVAINVEMLMNSISGAREVSIFAPFVLYNCTGISLILTDSLGDRIDNACSIPSYYASLGEGSFKETEAGLGLVPYVLDKNHDRLSSSTVSSLLSTRRCQDVVSLSSRSRTKVPSSGLSRRDEQRRSPDFHSNNSASKSRNSEADNVRSSNVNVKACMFFPKSNTFMNEPLVRVRSRPPECGEDKMPNSAWSSTFSLEQPSGPTCVVIPQHSTNGAFLVSVTCDPIAGPHFGRTGIVTFQPRYVICNACSKVLCYRQKGTDVVSYLGVGEHAHLHWEDRKRELLISIRFKDPGWQWSGNFLPEYLGDTQVKMWNYVSGTSSIAWVEIQNADVSPRDEKIFGSPHGSSGTNIILISDDDTGFMPYRIDNFSNQRVRVYQQQCETFETIVHCYSSCPYAWDEPFYPHLLTVEIPGKGVLGSYSLDDLKEHIPTSLGANFKKSDNKLLVSVHAEGAIKVLSIMDSSYHSVNDMEGFSVPWYREKEHQNQKHEPLLDYKEKLSVCIKSLGISLIDSHSRELVFISAGNIIIDLLQSADEQNLSFQISSLQIDNQLLKTPYPVVLSFDQEFKKHASDNFLIKEHSSEGSVGESTGSGVCQPVLYLAIAKWRNKDIGLVSVQHVNIRIADFHLEVEEDVLLSLFYFYRAICSRLQNQAMADPSPVSVTASMDLQTSSLMYNLGHQDSKSTTRPKQPVTSHIPIFAENWNKHSLSLPSVAPIGAPWQQIYLLARKQKKIYVEMFEIAPIKLTLSFSSTPWKLERGNLAPEEFLIHRGFIALADVAGARIKLKELTIAQHLASWESMQAILVRHYSQQLQHEIYKVFASATLIGNPMGFARSLRHGIKDFLTVPASSLQSPSGMVTGMAQGTTSLVRNTVYAMSDATSQITRAAQKVIAALAFDNQVATRKGVIDEVLQGLTGLLQAPIKEAEKDGLHGVVKGVALGVAELVARPVVSVLEVTGRTAQSIRARSKIHQTQRLRARLSRILNGELSLRPYSWEDTIGMTVLVQADVGSKTKGETLVVCKALKEDGKYVIITKRLMMIVSCKSLVGLGKPGFQGVPVDPEWIIEAEIGLDSIIHADIDGSVVHIVGSSSHSDPLTKQKGSRRASKSWGNSSSPLPLSQTNLELRSAEEADTLLQTLLTTIEQGKEQGWGSKHILHKSNIR